MNLFKNPLTHVFAAIIMAGSTGFALPLGGVITNMPSANETTVRTEAERQMKDKDTRFKSVKVENDVFDGYFIPASASTRLAVVSDDGVTITIDGAATNVTNFGAGQSDKNIDQVFKVVSTPTFVVGRAYRIKVDYSNTIHTDDNDFDGMTLFAFNGGGRTQEVNMIISRGQDGYAVPDDEEETIGAFTVANRNNTDNDGTPDNSDNNVPGEKDLMKLEISRPAGPATDKASVKVTSGSARFWESSTKVNPVPLVNGAAEFTLSNLPKTIYVETTATSPSLRSISIELDYKGSKDTVKATGVWVQFSGAAHDTKDAASLFADPVWSDTTAQPRDWIDGRGGTGLRPINTTNGVVNAILIKFTLLPSGVAGSQNVSFDITRQAEGRMWTQVEGGTPTLIPEATRTFPNSNEQPNDAIHNDDESVSPSAQGNIYSIDIPGLQNPQVPDGVDILTFRANFKEYVRVTFNGIRPLGNSVIGSRCSDKYLWHVAHKLEFDAGAFTGNFRRTTGDTTETPDNSIGDDHIVIGGPN